MTAKRELPPEPVPPSNVEAERAVLGAILLECSCSERPEWMAHWSIVSALEPGDFILSSHQTIYTRMAELVGAGSQVDIVTLVNRLTEEKEIESIGGVAYLASLTEGLPRRPRVLEYVKIIKAKSLLRRLISSCTEAARKAYDGESGFTILNDLKLQIADIEATARRGMRPLAPPPEDV